MPWLTKNFFSLLPVDWEDCIKNHYESHECELISSDGQYSLARTQSAVTFSVNNWTRAMSTWTLVTSIFVALSWQTVKSIKCATLSADAFAITIQQWWTRTLLRFSFLFGICSATHSEQYFIGMREAKEKNPFSYRDLTSLLSMVSDWKALAKMELNCDRYFYGAHNIEKYRWNYVINGAISCQKCVYTYTDKQNERRNVLVDCTWGACLFMQFTHRSTVYFSHLLRRTVFLGVKFSLAFFFIISRVIFSCSVAFVARYFENVRL